MAITRTNTRQLFNAAALPTSIGTSAGATVDAILGQIDSVMVNKGSVQTITGAKTFTSVGQAVTLSASNPGASESLLVQNTSAAASSNAQVEVLSDTANAVLRTYSSGTVASTFVKPNGTILDTNGSGGLSLAAVHAAGIIDFWNASLATATMSLSAAGLVTIGTSGGTQSHMVNGSLNVSQSINAMSGSNITSALPQLKLNADTTAHAPGFWLMNAASSGHYNWQVAAQSNVSDGFEVTPSTLVDGSTFTAPVFRVTQSGVATFGNNGTVAGSVAIANGGVGGASAVIQNPATTSTFNFNLPTTAGSVGQALLSGGGGSAPMTWATVLTNPMTTFGDIIYEDSTPAPARLPGNTNNLRQFLSSQGSGGTATAPAWATFVPPTMQNSFPLGSSTYDMTFAFVVPGLATVVAGDQYSHNGFSYVVYSSMTGSSLIYMNGTGFPLSSGTLTRTSGTGDPTVAFSQSVRPLYLRIKMVGGGGGGAGSAPTGSGGLAGQNGTPSSFGSLLTALGGTGGSSGSGVAGPGGGASVNAGAIGGSYTGSGGGGGIYQNTGVNDVPGGTGGASIFGGGGSAGRGQPGGAGSQGSGGGGGGNGATANQVSGGGGGAGGGVDAVVHFPTVGTTITIGSLGLGGSSSLGQVGGNGGQGYAEVWCHYQ